MLIEKTERSDSSNPQSAIQNFFFRLCRVGYKQYPFFEPLVAELLLNIEFVCLFFRTAHLAAIPQSRGNPKFGQYICLK